MKKIFLLYFIFHSVLADASNPDSIPNSGFEQWFIASWFEFPAGWETSNTQMLAPSVRKDSAAFSGNYALRLTHTNPAWARCGFPLTSHPTNFGGYMQNLLLNNDSAEISIRIFYNQQIVDSGHMVIFGGINPNYSSFIVPISQNTTNADSCVITLTGGTVDFSDLIYDDIVFDFAMGTGWITFPVVNPPYPNPCTDRIYIDTKGLDFISTTVEAYSSSGQYIILEKNNAAFPVDPLFLPQRNYISLSTERLSSGYWNIIMRNEEKSISFPIIKQ